MNQQRRFPIGIQTFEDIIQGDYAYVDKTRQVYNLANFGKCFFLSRPRRFGKSLLVSTLDAYFRGQKELFKGLAIEKLETKWDQYPVLWLDLNNDNYEDVGVLKSVLNWNLCEWEKLYGSSPTEDTFALRFGGIIDRAVEKTGKPVVILIDEYDKPLTETIDNDELNAQMRAILRGFYATLKSRDRRIRFALLTGVSKFSHVTIFSGLNNLIDISMVMEFADICGISEQELHDNFDADVQRLADANNITREQAFEKLRDNYDGYHFVPGGAGIYNPFSLMNVLEFCDFKDYWFSTGTPSFLVKVLQRDNFDLVELNEEISARAADLSNIDTHTDPIAVMYQSGYLTIKDYNPERKVYRLGFPNGEVKRGFNESLVTLCITQYNTMQRNNLSDRLYDAVAAGDVENMMTIFKQVFGSTPCHIKKDMDLEVHYRNTIYLMLIMCGHHAQVEKFTATGRMDVTIESKDYVYVLELKRGTTDEAAEQIEDRRYLDAYAADEREVIALAVALNDNTHNIGNWRVVNE